MRKRIIEIEGFEKVMDLYTIDKKGRVYSEFKKGYLNTSDNGHGYEVVSLKKSGCREWIKTYVHRLVALAFVPNPENKPQVNHIDENKRNNNVENLNWMTHKENNNYGTATERTRVTKTEKVQVYNYKCELLDECNGLSEATVRYLGYKDTKCLNKKSKEYIFLSKGNCTIKTAIKNSKNKPVQMYDFITKQYTIFNSNLDARKFFSKKINISDAIKYKWLLKNRYRVAYYFGKKDIV